MDADLQKHVPTASIGHHLLGKYVLPSHVVLHRGHQRQMGTQVYSWQSALQTGFQFHSIHLNRLAAWIYHARSWPVRAASRMTIFCVQPMVMASTSAFSAVNIAV